MRHRVILALTLLMLFATGVLGIYSGPSGMSSSVGPFQKTVGVAIILYGLLGLLATAGTILRKKWSVSVSIAWAVVLTFVAATAALAYAAESASRIGAVASGLVTGVGTWLVVRGVQVVVAPRNSDA